MRIILSVLLTSLLIGCSSQQLITEPQVFNYPGQTKKQLYDKSLQWIVYNFNSAGAVIDYKDPAAGRIIGKGVFTAAMVGSIKITMTIDVKDGRARLICTPTGYTSVDGKLDTGMYSGITGVTNDWIKYIRVQYDKFMRSSAQPVSADW